MWDASKTVLKEKCLQLNAYIYNEMLPINNLRSYIKKEGKKHNKINPKQAKGRQ